MENFENGFNPLNDIYYSRDYASLYADDETEVFTFEFRDSKHFFSTMSLKRPIRKVGNSLMPDIYYDLETPYGYGGFITNCQESDFRKRAFQKYREYCNSKNIIAEFIRFHPFNNFGSSCGDYLDFYRKDRKVVYIDLSRDYEDIRSSYEPSLRRNIKRGCSYGLKLQCLQASDADNFANAYYKTMEKKNADAFYFFEKDYFRKLQRLQGVSLYCSNFGGAAINYVIIFESRPFAYYHLGATDPAHYRLNPNAFIFDELVKKYKDKGFSMLYLGGGLDGTEADQLYKFKRKFSPKHAFFYIGGLIFIPEIYKKYIKLWEEQSEAEKDARFFLKYRRGIKHG